MDTRITIVAALLALTGLSGLPGPGTTCRAPGPLQAIELLGTAAAAETDDAKNRPAADDASRPEGATGDGQARRLPAFPGAEGFGVYARGGRGGRVIEVTTLEDYDPETQAPSPGSLRAGLNAEGPRTIVFRVAGWIDLEAPLWLREPYCTIAGQTAPGGGIGLRGETFGIGSGDVEADVHDVIVRHLRVRCGPGREQGRAPDAFKINHARRVILDHCSISWGVDECLAITAHPWKDDDGEPLAVGDRPRARTQNITIQWCIISEGLYESTHPKGHHSRGVMCTYGSSRVSMHHNLMAHNARRNPNLPWQLAGYDNPYLIDVVNNVAYNWLSQAGLTGHASSRNPGFRQKGRINFIGNRYLMGPDSRKVHALEIRNRAEVFAAGNLTPHRPSHDADPFASVRGNFWKAEQRLDAPEVTTQRTEEAMSLVLKRAGATRPQRDAVDQRIVQEVRQREGSIIDHPDERGGWPRLAPADPPSDADHDGMPDPWERRHGLTPDTPDHNGDADGDGYTNLEEYLNSTDPTEADTSH